LETALNSAKSHDLVRQRLAAGATEKGEPRKLLPVRKKVKELQSS